MRKLALALFLLALAGCGGDNEAATTVTTASTPPPRAPNEVLVTISYAKGKLAGGIKTVKVDKGMRVVLRVSSDVADEVHVHGPDIKRDVTPGKPVRVSFVADTPGRYEVELEQRSVQIADIQVQP